MSMIRMITYLIGLVLPMIMDGYGSWTLWRILFHHGSSLVRSNEVASWNHYITYASTSWGFHPWGNLVSNPNHQPGCPKSPYKKMILCLIKSQIIHDFFFGRQKSINKNQPILLLPSNCSFSKPPPKKNGGFPPPNWGFFQPKNPPLSPPNAVMACHPVVAAPSWDSSCRRHPNRKRRWGPRTTARQNCSGAPGPKRFRVFPQEGRREARFFWGDFLFDMSHGGSPKDPKNNKKTHRCCWSSLLRWFVGWFFWGGQTEETSQKGAIFTGHIHKVEKCFGPLDDWRAFFFNVFLFEIKIGLVPTKLEAFEPTTQRNPFRRSRNFARRSVEDDGTWWKLQVLPCSNPLGLPFH